MDMTAICGEACGSEALPLALDVPYGTPEMAREVQRLFRETDVRTRKIFAMAGHTDGIVAFGQDFRQALAMLAAAAGRSIGMTS